MLDKCFLKEWMMCLVFSINSCKCRICSLASIFQEGRYGQKPSFLLYPKSLLPKNNRAEGFWEEQPLSKMKNSEAYPSTLSNKSFKPCILFIINNKPFSEYLKIPQISGGQGKPCRGCSGQESDSGCFTEKPISWAQGGSPLWFLSNGHQETLRQEI